MAKKRKSVFYCGHCERNVSKTTIIVIKLIFTINLVIHGVLVNQHSMIFPLKEVNRVNQCII